MEVVVLACVGVGEDADVADEAGFAEEVLEAGALGGVVTWCGGGGHDGWVAGFDCGIDAAGGSVGREGLREEVGELGVCLDGCGDEEVGFVADVREDEGGGEFVVVAWWEE